MIDENNGAFKYPRMALSTHWSAYGRPPRDRRKPRPRKDSDGYDLPYFPTYQGALGDT